jgi:hypothetical protein
VWTSYIPVIPRHPAARIGVAPGNPGQNLMGSANTHRSRPHVWITFVNTVCTPVGDCSVLWISAVEAHPDQPCGIVGPSSTRAHGGACLPAQGQASRARPTPAARTPPTERTRARAQRSTVCSVLGRSVPAPAYAPAMRRPRQGSARSPHAGSNDEGDLSRGPAPPEHDASRLMRRTGQAENGSGGCRPVPVAEKKRCDPVLLGHTAVHRAQ